MNMDEEVPTFWGVEVPGGGKAVPFVPPPTEAKLHVSQACLAPGAKANARARLLVKVQEGPGLVIAALREGAVEMASLDLVFDEYTEFSVEGNAGVHLTGYHMPMNDEDEGPGGMGEEDEDDDDEEYTPEEMKALKQMILQRGGQPPDSDDEDEDDEEDDEMLGMEGSSDEDDDVDEADSDLEEEQKSTVVIEEIPLEEAPLETAAKKRKADAAAMEKPGSAKKQQQTKAEAAMPAAAKAAAKADKSAQKAAQLAAKAEAAAEAAAKTPSAQQNQKQAQTPAATPSAAAAEPNGAAPKSGRKGVRKFPNGFEIADVAMGQPDGKLAKAGKRVKVKYVGRLAKNGKVFDSTKGNKTFTFRLGVGEVIKGWDKGVEGMRVGDKRKLTVPASMGYGPTGAPPDIPGNSTLIFDVELVNVM